MFFPLFGVAGVLPPYQHVSRKESRRNRQTLLLASQATHSQAQREERQQQEGPVYTTETYIEHSPRQDSQRCGGLEEGINAQRKEEGDDGLRPAKGGTQ